MNFLYSALIGLVFGFSNEKWFSALLWIFFCLIALALKDILFRKDFITKTASPYVIYVENLIKQKNNAKGAIIKYILQSLLIDGGISILIFFIVRFFK